MYGKYVCGFSKMAGATCATNNSLEKKKDFIFGNFMN